MVYTIGAYLDLDALDLLLGRILENRMVKPLLNLPEGVEICRRSNPEGWQVGILINHTREEQHISLPFPAQDHLGARKLQGTFSLKPFEVIVFTQTAEESS